MWASSILRDLRLSNGETGAGDEKSRSDKHDATER